MAAFRFRAGAIHEAAFQHPKLRAVRNHVREHIADVNGPTLVEVAKLAGLSPKYFSDFFEQHVGVVFSVWRSRTKIERAKELFLDAPWSPVGAIGIGVGYPDLTTFARAFKRCEGDVPPLSVAEGFRVARHCNGLGGQLFCVLRGRQPAQ